VSVTAIAIGGHDAGDNVAVCAPGPGVWRPSVRTGQLVRPGDVIGRLEVLGHVDHVIAPDGAFGAVVEIGSSPVGYGSRLYLLDPAASIGGVEAREAAKRAHAAEGLVFTAPTSGRLYWKPGPGKPPFVKVGDILKDGQTVCLLEVMKTFNRVTYEAGAHGLPDEARVVEIAAGDEVDVEPGAVLLRLEAAT
jgi:acetyl-CoA carboxylase biotin carboxyl carrier protein